VGGPGTGKSTGAKMFGDCLRELGIVRTNNFHSCTAKDFIGQYMGETDKKTYELLKKSTNGILFIDEAYSLSYADAAHSDSSYKKEALEQIIAFMDVPEHRRRCCLIFAGYRKDMQGLYRSNSGMRSRIEEVWFADYSAGEMYEIFELFCKKNGYTVGEGVKSRYLPIFENMTRMEYYSNGRTARTVFEKTALNLKRRVARSEEADGADEAYKAAQTTIMTVDLLNADECYKIVTASQGQTLTT
jgi:AAA+ superfamily predicted ATPase